MSNSWLILTGMLLAVLGAVTMACGSDQEELPDVDPTYCDSLANLRAAAIGFDDFGPDSTMTDLQVANVEYALALQEATEATEQLRDVITAPIEDAYADVAQAVDDIPDNATTGQGLVSIQPELAAIDDAYQVVFSPAETSC